MSDPRAESSAAFWRPDRYEPSSQRIGLAEVAAAWLLAALLIAILALVA